MEEWTTTFVNDPDDDYRLTLELEYDDEVVAVIKKVDGKAILTTYKEIDIPSEWLEEQMERARTEIE